MSQEVVSSHSTNGMMMARFETLRGLKVLQFIFN